MLSAKDKEKNLKIAKAVPFSETNRQLIELDFPGETRESGDMMRLLDTMMSTGLKGDRYQSAAESLYLSKRRNLRVRS